jgi:hypothetical protein
MSDVRVENKLNWKFVDFRFQKDSFNMSKFFYVASSPVLAKDTFRVGFYEGTEDKLLKYLKVIYENPVIEFSRGMTKDEFAVLCSELNVDGSKFYHGSLSTIVEKSNKLTKKPVFFSPSRDGGRVVSWWVLYLYLFALMGLFAVLVSYNRVAVNQLANRLNLRGLSSQVGGFVYKSSVSLYGVAQQYTSTLFQYAKTNFAS